MKPPVSPRTAALLLFAPLSPLAAQSIQDADRSSDVRPVQAGNLAGSDAPRFHASALPPARYEVPAHDKTSAELSQGNPLYVSQDSVTLGSVQSPARSVEDVADLDVLRQPSPFRKLAVSASGESYSIQGGALQNGLALLSAVYRESGQAAAAADCHAVALSVQQQTLLDPANRLALLEEEISANPGCACEIVKSAIRASGGSVSNVANIVEVAATAAPDMMRMISQCAIAEVPESLAEVQAVLARIEPNAGETAAGSSKSAKSAKSAKGAKVAAITPPVPPNPLDLPLPFPLLPPPPIFPPPVTVVNP